MPTEMETFQKQNLALLRPKRRQRALGVQAGSEDRIRMLAEDKPAEGRPAEGKLEACKALGSRTSLLLLKIIMSITQLQVCLICKVYRRRGSWNWFDEKVMLNCDVRNLPLGSFMARWKNLGQVVVL